ncbi:MAG: type II toxin-antitoxin system RelE/ParE family toxin [Chitinophagales bacterium]|nr:type II toxin-antitoxin system RelE/ParE family toxin [Chitinophagales bacterium]
MTKTYDVKFLEPVIEFLDSLEEQERDKILFNITKAKVSNDKELFKKLNGEIWEFRTLFNKKQFRLLAFWDKGKDKETLVIATHGFIKKSKKTPKNEIERAEKIRTAYTSQK